MNGNTVSFIIETHVATHNRNVEGETGGAHALNHLCELPHHLGIFRTAEVQAIRETDGARADASEIARRLHHRQYAADVRVQIAVAAVAVPGQRAAFCGSLES